MNDESDSYKNAKERVMQLRGFYEHLAVYLIINIMLFIINLTTSPQSLWFYWVTIFWGIGLLLHAWKTFAGNAILGREWEEKKIREYMENEKK